MAGRKPREGAFFDAVLQAYFIRVRDWARENFTLEQILKIRLIGGKEDDDTINLIKNRFETLAAKLKMGCGVFNSDFKNFLKRASKF